MHPLLHTALAAAAQCCNHVSPSCCSVHEVFKLFVVLSVLSVSEGLPRCCSVLKTPKLIVPLQEYMQKLLHLTQQREDAAVAAAEQHAEDVRKQPPSKYRKRARKAVAHLASGTYAAMFGEAEASASEMLKEERRSEIAGRIEEERPFRKQLAEAKAALPLASGVPACTA